MNYAVIEINGSQLWVEKGRFYDVNKINCDIGSVIQLRRVLLINTLTDTLLGYPYVVGTCVVAIILKHFKESKIIVYKMKPKKKMRRKFGFRKEITRILIKKI